MNAVKAKGGNLKEFADTLRSLTVQIQHLYGKLPLPTQLIASDTGDNENFKILIPNYLASYNTNTISSSSSWITSACGI